MPLSAHFGQWLQVGRKGRQGRQWQVAAGLIYGQVKKSYQRRKLRKSHGAPGVPLGVRVTHVMRLGTEDADPRLLAGDGLLWEAEHRFH